MRKRFPVLAALAALFLALTSCAAGEGEVAGVQSTPVRTVRPVFTSTTTPTPTVVPSDTPLPTATSVPTDTPLPPSDTPPPTDTPAPEVPTEAPTAELPSPTASPQPAPPTATTAPQPQPTAPPPPTAAPKPAVDFRITEIVAFPDPGLGKTDFHNIYFTVLDAGGAPLDGIVLEEVNNQPTERLTTGDKGPGRADFIMWGFDYRFKVVGDAGGQAFSSETTHVLSVLQGHAVWEDLIRGGICADVASCQALPSIHYSYKVTFQRTW
ncbi:MAG: hypothetical protein RBU35_07330 [Anaerolineae bacterium]|jgi:hypothetical protein|nr:hypothetical protein [Anaerolineae bacterium]